MSAPWLAQFDTEDALYAYLDRLNQDGHTPELPAMDARGRGYLATLTDPDADRVHHVVTDEGGRAHACDDSCTGPFSPCSWRPAYPVVALSQQDPADVYREIARAT